jgi:Tfp pilus assembly protein PilF
MLAHNYPDSSNAYTVLGETYAKSGNKQLACDIYNKAIEKDSTNAEAKNKLRELDASAPTPN